MPQFDLPLPPPQLRFMNEDDQRFWATGRESLGVLRRCGFGPDSSVLDLGCGYGRLAYAILADLDFRGLYLGLDILPRHLKWCSQTITPRFPNVQFQHLNIYNERYNPTGLLDARALTLPLPDASFDYGALFSVFTHMFEEEIQNYLRELHRVLKTGGLGICTFFLFDEARLKAILDEKCPYRMQYQLNDHTRYFNQKDKLHGIAYHRDQVRMMIETCGLQIVEMTYGSWARDGQGTFQDLVVLRRP